MQQRFTVEFFAHDQAYSRIRNGYNQCTAASIRSHRERAHEVGKIDP